MAIVAGCSIPPVKKRIIDLTYQNGDKETVECNCCVRLQNGNFECVDKIYRSGVRSYYWR